MGGHALLGDMTGVQHSDVHQALHDELWLEEILAFLVEPLHQSRVSTGQEAQGIAPAWDTCPGHCQPRAIGPHPCPPMFPPGPSP